ncbi:iron complex transport system substrate-binding protein [Amycolatopsis arida]|uniref:Iron complex transport system substrate-binding protein n=1 Tax=Amycolatopsis arida TaxID=587909 RepID=A0A1I5XTJ1_9PSEU|nr:ABC transporter substrate-binding protein [Amycolatopsis arida]TDX97275.1 iron complex transport system substrate-binding protein [Amycolatopsis arida]SFQ35234.1 iron complex transport system substrate-binding protein [Amycolatopsis arida]
MSRPAPLRALLPVLALLGVAVLAGCANREEPAEPAPGDAAFPVTVRAEGAPAVTLEKRPERIVSLSPSATETLFAVGAGQQVVAVDNQSTHPPQAPRTDLSGLNLDPEAILAHSPDLVVVSADRENQLTGALGKAGVRTLVLPDARTLQAAYDQFALVGTATGHADEGADLARRTREDIEKIVADTPKPNPPLTYYHELDPTYYTTTSATFIGQVYGLFGLVNIADGDDPNASGGYPQLSAERILRANPDLIFLADTNCCGQNAETVAARPGWDTLDAVKEGRVYPLNDDVASRWSPRVVDLVHAVADAVRGAGS